VVIRDFDLICVSVPPYKTDAPLIIHPDTVLPFPVVAEYFQVIAGRHPQIFESAGRINHKQFTPGHFFNVHKPFAALPLMQFLCLCATERLYHVALSL
jgi:hypothetical protein